MFSFPEKMKVVFKDEKMQAAFEELGYVVIDYYNKEEMAYLEELFYQYHKKEDLTGFYSGTFSPNQAFRVAADKAIRAKGSRSINQYLKDYKIIYGWYIVKAPDEKSEMSVHQDMTLVDESEFTGINIWSPLLDLNEHNGPLMVLDGSHRICPTYRGGTIPGIYENTWEDIIKLMKPIYLKKGQAIVFDQSILHYSPANISKEVRVVTNTYLTHKDARFVTAYRNPDNLNQIEVYKQEAAVVHDFDQFTESIRNYTTVGEKIGYVDYDFPMITNKDLNRLYGLELLVQPNESNKQKGFLSKLFSKITRR